jgi:hypothetical protein
LRIALAGALALLGTAAYAGPAQDRATLEELQREDSRLQSIGWRLAVGNARFCANAAPAIGLLLQDMANYAAPARMRAAAGIAGEVAVQAVASGSPSAAAGLLPNDEIVAIDGESMAALPPAKARSWQRLTGLHDRIDQSLARDGNVELEWRRGNGARQRTIVRGVLACPGRFELLDRGGKASADGDRVLIGREFVGTDYVEDEFAAALAHEYAHNLLRHRAWLDEHGRGRRNARRTEREADRLMPWLLANAGYDPSAAVRFFERWGPRHDGWIFRARDHDGWDERRDFVAIEIARIEALKASGQEADWPRHFQREVSP